MKVYTKTGDEGSTGLVTGERVLKSHLRIEAYGAVDELNAVIGILIEELRRVGAGKFVIPIDEMVKVQTELFSIGSELACADGAVPKSMENVVIGTDAALPLEHSIDEMTKELPRLASFVLPGGCKPNAYAHLARTVCRRAERACVGLAESGETVRSEVLIYLNRLSDWFFVLSRLVSHRLHVSEVPWVSHRKANT